LRRMRSASPLTFSRVHRLPLSVRPNDQVMETQGEFDDGIEARERSIARPHFLDHYPAVPRAEHLHHAAGENALRKPVCALWMSGICCSTQ
jgi:hypothetical protein